MFTRQAGPGASRRGHAPTRRSRWPAATSTSARAASPATRRWSARPAPRCCATASGPAPASTSTTIPSCSAPGASAPTCSGWAGKYPDAWHYEHMKDPRSTSPRQHHADLPVAAGAAAGSGRRRRVGAHAALPSACRTTTRTCSPGSAEHAARRATRSWREPRDRRASRPSPDRRSSRSSPTCSGWARTEDVIQPAADQGAGHRRRRHEPRSIRDGGRDRPARLAHRGPDGAVPRVFRRLDSWAYAPRNRARPRRGERGCPSRMEATSEQERADQILGHAAEADGIEEYDNPMPDWWLGLFYRHDHLGRRLRRGLPLHRQPVARQGAGGRDGRGRRALAQGRPSPRRSPSATEAVEAGEAIYQGELRRLSRPGARGRHRPQPGGHHLDSRRDSGRCGADHHRRCAGEGDADLGPDSGAGEDRPGAPPT